MGVSEREKEKEIGRRLVVMSACAAQITVVAAMTQVRGYVEIKVKHSGGVPLSKVQNCFSPSKLAP